MTTGATIDVVCCSRCGTYFQVFYDRRKASMGFWIVGRSVDHDRRNKRHVVHLCHFQRGFASVCECDSCLG